MKKLLFSGLFLLSANVMAAAITGVTTQSNAAGDYQIVFHNANVRPNSFALQSPASIVLDFPNTKSALRQKEFLVRHQGIRSVDVLAAGDRTRAVVNLERNLVYMVSQHGNDVYVSFPGLGNATQVASASRVPATAKPIVLTPQTNTSSVPPEPVIRSAQNTVPATAKPIVLTPRTNTSSVPPEPVIRSTQHTVPATAKPIVLAPQTNTASVPPEPVIRSTQNTVPVTAKPIVLSQANPTTAEDAPAMTIAPPAVPTAPASSALRAEFHKISDAGGSLSFHLASDNLPVDVETQGEFVEATISGYKVPKSAQKRMDVSDYGSPVRYVDITQGQGNTTKIRLYMGRNNFSVKSYQTGSTYYIDINKPTEAQQIRERAIAGLGDSKSYTGQPISLNFQDIEVRAVLQIIAEFTNQNIVVSDSVRGNITLRLNNVPWDQALDIILKTKALGMRKSGNIIYIAPEAELNNSEIDALTSLQKKEDLLPMHTELIQLKYAKATDIATILEQSRDNNNGSGSNNNSNSVLSSRGSVTVDARTNTLLVSDISSKLQSVRDLVARLDKAVRQVMIDSRLVITSSSFNRTLGSRFGLAFGNGGTWGASGTLEDSTAIAGGSLGSSSLSNRLGVNLPATSTGANPGSFGVSILGKDILVDLELQALQNEGMSEVISNPKVVTQDGYKALVSSGQEIPYSSSSANNGPNTEFKDAKLSMDVTPHITPNNRVGMEIHISDDSAASNYVNGEPPINTNEINTKVDVDNGATVVLGGIYSQTQSITTSKVPLLGDIPIIGNLFKNTNKEFNKDELLIFITPRIIDESVSNTNQLTDLQN